MPAPQMIPVDKIAPGDNPRGAIDESSESFKELCGSIEARGVLQSILVGPANGGGKHKVIAGHRRFAAAQQVKLKEIPAMVVDAGGAELTLALIENVQREDLTPVAEARAIAELREKHGFTQKEAADALNKSERWARERERLVHMPEKAQQAYDAGALPLESIGTMEKIAKQAPAAAEALAEAAAKDDLVRNAMSGDRVPEALQLLIVDAAENLNKDGTSKLGCLVQAGDAHYRRRVSYEALVVAGAPHDQLKAVKDQLAEWRKRRDRLRRLDSWRHPSDPNPMWFDPADHDAARTFGCLLEVDDALYITDAAWLADRFLQHVQAANEEIEKEIESTKASKKGSKGTEKKGSKEQEEAEKAQRRREREEEQERRDAARANNLELGQRVAKAFAAPKLSLDEAKLLALLVVGNHATGLGARGIKYCFHDYQDEEQLKNGRTKVTYANAAKAGEDLVSQIRAAKKPEQALGAALQAVILANFADQECVAPSARSWHSIGDHSADDAVDALLTTIANKRSVLPDAVRERVARQQQKENESLEFELLYVIKDSRAKKGVTRQRLEATHGIPEHIFASALSSKWIKEHDADGEPSYTILAAGRKRLEKLKAAAKERQAAK